MNAPAHAPAPVHAPCAAQGPRRGVSWVSLTAREGGTDRQR
jgi:hypothetical protein